MKFNFLLVIFFIITNHSFGQTECDIKLLESNYSKVLETLESKISKIQAGLEGQRVDGLILREVFGLNFSISQTKDKVQSIRDSIEKHRGISLENRSLLGCLESFNRKEDVLKFVDKATQLRYLEIALLEKNERLQDSFRESSVTELALPDLKEKIEGESKRAIGIKRELENDLIQMQKAALKQKDEAQKDLLAIEGELTKVKISLLNEKIKIIKNFEEKISRFEQSNKMLKELSSSLNNEDKQSLFKKTEKLWSSVNQENYFDLFWEQNNLELSEIPDLKFDQNSIQTKKLLKMTSELRDLRREILKIYREKKDHELRLLNQLVASSNAMRSSLFKELGYRYFFNTIFSLRAYQLIENELINAPYRLISFFYSKYLHLKELIGLGREGLLQMASILIQLLLIVGSCFGLSFLWKQLKIKLDFFVQHIFRRYSHFLIVRRSFALWTKIKEIFYPIMWLITLSFAQKQEFFSEIILFIEAVEYYYAAIILQTFVKIFLGTISKIDSSNYRNFKEKVEITSGNFKKVFLFYCYTMIFFEATIGRVYLYTIVKIIVMGYALYFIVKDSTNWESDFTRYIERKFSGAIVNRYFKFLSICPQKFRAILLLLFIIIFLFFDLFISLTENFEVSKRVSANFFKKQIENIEAEDGADTKIPAGYKSNFAPQSLEDLTEYVSNDFGLENQIIQEVLEWNDGSSEEHSVVVFGDKGIGKTTLLHKVASEISEKIDVNVRYTKLPSKTTTKERLKDFLGEAFNLEIKSSYANVNEIDQNLQKKIVLIIDEAQNIFLSETGSFSAYYELTNLINLNTQNIFWILSFNKYSWVYLDRAFGRTQFFRNAFELRGWPDNKIKELIMRRHSRSELNLSFDLLINATKSQDEIDRYSSVESKFFKLLWEMSHGNPRAAMFLWISALSRKNRKTLNVNIPKEADFDGIEKLSDELMFVIADVLKHENLTSSEIESTTNLPHAIVRNAIKLAMEKRFFYRDERKRYMIDINKQYGIVKNLKLKNFIYGSK